MVDTATPCLELQRRDGVQDESEAKSEIKQRRNIVQNNTCFHTLSSTPGFHTFFQ